MAGLVFLLGFWVLAGACQRSGVGGFLLCNTTTATRTSYASRFALYLHRQLAPPPRREPKPGPGVWLRLASKVCAPRDDS